MSKVIPADSRDKTKEIVLFDHVSPWLTFRESEQRHKFEEFKVHQSSIYPFLVIYFAACVTLILTTWFALANNPSVLGVINLVLVVVSPVCAGLLLIGFRLVAQNPKQKYISREILSRIIINLESFWLLSCCCAYSLSIVLCIQNGECESDDFESVQGCNNDPSTLPLDMTMVSLVIPAIFATILKGAKWEYVLLAFAYNFGSIVFCSIYYNLIPSLFPVVLFTPCCMVMMYEYQRQNIAVFLLTQSQKHLLEENERLADETHAVEMRHMIGNVAHDLKTVSVLCCCDD